MKQSFLINGVSYTVESAREPAAISLELERVRTRRKAGEPSMSVSKSAAAELWLISKTA